MGAEQENDDPEKIDWDARKKIKDFTVEEGRALTDAIQRAHDRDVLAEEKRKRLERDR